jgi:hypothetical protein
MSWHGNAVRLGVPLCALALAAGLTLAGCSSGGGLIPSGSGAGANGGNTAAAGGGGGADSADCSGFETAFKAFENGAIPAGGSGNRWDQLESAIGDLFGGNMPTSQAGLDMYQVELDAMSITDDISQGGAGSQDFATLNSDLEKVGQDCGTTFTQATSP